MLRKIRKILFRKKESIPTIISKTIAGLQENEAAIDKKFTYIPVEQISVVVQNNIVNTAADQLRNVSYDIGFLSPILEELNNLKEKLGGSPVFGSKSPTLKSEDSNKFFLGAPLASVKDWFRMTLKKGWLPKIFWKSVSKVIFNITEENKMSQYEEAHIRIQRFGLLIANKKRFFEILDTQNVERYNELSKITGLAWHPNSNGAGTEKIYIRFIEHFLTTCFNKAKEEGSEALLEYFNAFSGVCFEDRARTLEEYINKHPIENIELPSDWDTGKPVKDAYTKEMIALAVEIKGTPTIKQLFERFTKKGIFNLEFLTPSGNRAKPSKEDFDEWVKEQVDADVLEEDDFFKINGNRAMG